MAFLCISLFTSRRCINYFNLQDAADLAKQPSRSQLCHIRTCRLLGLVYETDGRTRIKIYENELLRKYLYVSRKGLGGIQHNT